MGEKRSLAAMAIKMNRSERAVQRLSSVYHWQMRLAEYNVQLQLALTAKWQARQEEVRIKDFEQASKLRDLADRILTEGPKFVKATTAMKRDANGNPVQVVTMALDGKLMVDSIAMASKLQRQVTGIDAPAGQLKITVEYTHLVEELRKRGIDASEVFSAMLQELAANDANVSTTNENTDE